MDTVRWNAWVTRYFVAARSGGGSHQWQPDDFGISELKLINCYV